ncbi:hypothetical protein FOCC_FOCC010983 [Frankliniella occidentalis]|nr:hypothetical protein FOCC_FOCC010983 [Frankliniella occidentalis]
MLSFIGKIPPKRVRFRPPIALTSARFMGRIIYCLTISMFAMAGQCDLDRDTLSNMRGVTLSLVTTYIEPWNTDTIPAIAPRMDLELMKHIMKYPRRKVRDITWNACSNHLWYLSPHCVALALFDKEVSDEVKQNMIRTKCEFK